MILCNISQRTTKLESEKQLIKYLEEEIFYKQVEITEINLLLYNKMKIKNNNNKEVNLVSKKQQILKM